MMGVCCGTQIKNQIFHSKSKIEEKESNQIVKWGVNSFF